MKAQILIVLLFVICTAQAQLGDGWGLSGGGPASVDSSRASQISDSSKTALPLAGGTMTGSILAGADNTLDIGTTGGNKFRDVAAGRYVSGYDLIATRSLAWSTNTKFNLTSDGVIVMLDAAETSFNRLQFGGATSSYPSIAKRGASLALMKADTSGTCLPFFADKAAARAAGLGHGYLYMTVTAAGDTIVGIIP